MSGENMIEKYSDLELAPAATLEEVEAIIKDKLGLSFSTMRSLLSSSLLESVDTIVSEMVNIVPFGDYSVLLEEPEDMAKFLKEEATKEEHWKIESIGPNEVDKKTLISFIFYNAAVDDGDIIKGFVYTDLAGNIKHAFVQG